MKVFKCLKLLSFFVFLLASSLVLAGDPVAVQGELKAAIMKDKGEPKVEGTKKMKGKTEDKKETEWELPGVKFGSFSVIGEAANEYLDNFVGKKKMADLVCTIFVKNAAGDNFIRASTTAKMEGKRCAGTPLPKDGPALKAALAGTGYQGVECGRLIGINVAKA